MVQWIVDYRRPDGGHDQTMIEMPPDVEKAIDVQQLIEGGKVDQLYIPEGLIYRVQRAQAPPIV
jgi:hypothetical protein